ncbi:MAG: phosphoethanolamine transferase [Bacteroidales bacterium]|nr:phosphoethanolamine transferase [Bacteroidales bacterium]MCK9447700.1 phosphoethanolamine transferase [Bacteroidales bacterium]MDD3700205.1 phosphoethanolamine transferase [Bacteroidales bacterium]MDY0370077.1 phosphoethanolamine transferase [Bacteroidales bacterium]
MAINHKLSEIKTGILSLFPWQLTLLINYPLILGLIVNHPLVDTRLIVINLLYQSVFMIIVRLFRSKLLYQIGFGVYGVISFIESLHWIIIKSPLSQSSIFIVAATNLQESSDFLSLKIGLNILLLVPLLILMYLGWKHKPYFRSFPFSGLFQSIFIGVFIIFIIENAAGGRLVRKGIPHFAKVVSSYLQERQLFQQAQERSLIQLTKAQAKMKPLTVVMVFGESSNRSHWHLFGHPLETTPLLSKRADLYLFDNVVSAYSNTISSILTSLSENTVDHQLPIGEQKDIFDIFKSAGYTTYWVSNQAPLGVWENMITVFAHKADHEIFVNLAASSSMESTLTRSYDELLFKPVQKILQANDSLQLLIVHTMGNHTAYRKRYPPIFNRFSGADKKSQIISEYHNSILYHDYFLDSLLKIVEHHTNSVVVYASDHGENVYDEQGELGHTFAGRLPKANVEIPFFIWLSDTYRSTMDTAAIKSRREAAYVTDNLIHTLIDLGKIETPLLNPAASILNPAFDPSRKRILEDGYDYDE